MSLSRAEDDVGRLDARLTARELIRAQWRVLVALMIRDLGSRFFGSKLGNLVSIAWTLSHILILVVLNTAAGRAPPYGESSALWFATGAVPFMCFQYMSRSIMLSAVVNRPLLMFPAVKFTDIVLSRALVELVNAGVVIIAVAAIFAALRIDFMPRDIVGAVCAIFACLLLGLGAGIVNAMIAGMAHGWMTGYFLLGMLLWMVSGVFFVPSALPAPAQYILSFNPVTQGLEWLRASYYEGYGMRGLDRGYMMMFSLVLLAGGLCCERLLRGRILQN
jgi:capsular polysaccharide transport system permease protein